MGAWNYGVFDDDTAYDALDDLKAAEDIVKNMEEYFDIVIESEYVEYDDAHYALVSATIIDSILNKTEHRCDDEEYSQWIQTWTNLDVSSLKSKAIKAINAILSENSELKELWEENDSLYESWKEEKLLIQKRLL